MHNGTKEELRLAKSFYYAAGTITAALTPVVAISSYWALRRAYIFFEKGAEGLSIFVGTGGVLGLGLAVASGLTAGKLLKKGLQIRDELKPDR